MHRIVRRLVRQAKKHVSIEVILCDRGFDSIRVFQTLSNLGVNYLIPKRINSIRVGRYYFISSHLHMHSTLI